MGTEEIAYVVRSLDSAEPSAVLIGPSGSAPRDLEQRFVNECAGGVYLLEDARYNTESLNGFVDWLTQTQGFRRLAWTEWTV